jgi:thioredoxin
MKELTDTTFKQAVAKGNVIVDFWAPWCGPCRMMAPFFDEVSKNHPTVTFAKLNTDESQRTAMELGIRGIPTLILFKDGKEINRYVGASSKQQLETRVRENFLA